MKNKVGLFSYFKKTKVIYPIEKIFEIKVIIYVTFEFHIMFHDSIEQDVNKS